MSGMARDGFAGLRVFAFWSYDGFPYVLGAEVRHVHPDGLVSVVGYPGFRFRSMSSWP